MAIEVGDKIYRNLPEQVEWLSNQFVRILEAFEELGTVMRYKGSVATYADLPTENNKVGDVYNVIDTGSNYAWDGEGWDEIGSTVDLSNLVTLNTEQDITAKKNLIDVGVKFSNTNNVGYTIQNRGDGYLSIYNNNNNVVYDFDNNGFINRSNQDLGSSTYKWKNIFLGNSSASISWKIEPTTWGSLRINDGSGNTYFAIYNSSGQKRVGAGVDATVDLGSSNERWKDLYLSGRIYLSDNAYIYGSNYYIYSKGHFYPDYLNTYDLGAPIYTWRNLYLAGAINPNSSGYGLTLPSTASLAANSELVDTGSAQTISGVKTFSNGIKTPIIDTTNEIAFKHNGAIRMVFTTQELRPQNANYFNLGSNGFKWNHLYLSGDLKDGTNSVAVAEIAKKPTTVTVEIDGQMTTEDISAHSGKIVVLAPGEQASGTWEVNFTLPSTIVAVGITKSGSTSIEITGTSITNHTLKITNLDELDQSSFCVIDLSDGLTAKVMAGRNF